MPIRNTLKIKSKIFALAAIATALLSSCSCNWHLKQVQNRCPDYLQADTSYTVRPAVQYDTVFFLSPDTGTSTGSAPVVDTFLIEKERVRVQLVRVHDTLLANVELPPDTITTVRTVTVAPPCPEQGLPWSALPLLLAFTAVVALWVRKKIKG